MTLDEGLEQLYYPTESDSGTIKLLIPDRGRLTAAHVTPTNPATFVRDYEFFSLPPPVSKKAAKARLGILSPWGSITRENAQAVRENESTIAPEAGESMSSASAMCVGVNREFLRQLRALFRIIFPSLRSKETYLFLLHSMFLVLRTYLSLLVARLDGYIVKTLISADRWGFLRGLGLWFALAVTSTYTNSMIRFLQSKLSISFRTRLTRYVHDLYLNQHQNFYRVTNLDNRLDAVSQYITHDIVQFCDVLSELYSNISKPLLDMLIFVWQIGQNPVSYTHL